MEQLANNTVQTSLPDEVLMNRIYVFRGQKVMLDKDLAELYGVETRVLNQAVSRNLDRFPTEFISSLFFWGEMDSYGIYVSIND